MKERDQNLLWKRAATVVKPVSYNVQITVFLAPPPKPKKVIEFEEVDESPFL